MPETAPRFKMFLRAAAALAAARQLSGLVFVGALACLPLLVSRAWTTEFLWAYFSMMTLTSLFGLGFERLAGTLIGERVARADCTGADEAPIGALLLVRVATTPLVAVGQWALLTFVGVALSPVAWVATLAWTMFALAAPLLYGALRAAGNVATEPKVMVSTRVTQCAALLALAAAGLGVAAVVGAVALLELLGLVLAGGALGRACFEGASVGAIVALPWRRAVALAGVEIVSLAYLRADLLLVGRILGPELGAAYGLVYRVIDGLNGAVGSVGVWLYAETVAEREVPDDASGLRGRSLTLLPRLAVGVAFLLVLGSQVVVLVSSSLQSEVRTLQYLIVAFPLLSINAIELHVRSGRGRNREVVRTGVVALFVNVVLCLALVPMLGLRGAALALIGSEIMQSIMLVRDSTSAERGLLVRALTLAGGGSALLFGLGALLDAADLQFAAVGAAISVVFVVAWILGSWRTRRVVAS